MHIPTSDETVVTDGLHEKQRNVASGHSFGSYLPQTICLTSLCKIEYILAT